MERKDYIMNALKKYGINTPEELDKQKIKPLNISLMVAKPAAEEAKDKSVV